MTLWTFIELRHRKQDKQRPEVYTSSHCHCRSLSPGRIAEKYSCSSGTTPQSGRRMMEAASQVGTACLWVEEGPGLDSKSSKCQALCTTGWARPTQPTFESRRLVLLFVGHIWPESLSIACRMSPNPMSWVASGDSGAEPAFTMSMAQNLFKDVFGGWPASSTCLVHSCWQRVSKPEHCEIWLLGLFRCLECLDFRAVEQPSSRPGGEDFANRLAAAAGDASIPPGSSCWRGSRLAFRAVI